MRRYPALRRCVLASGLGILVAAAAGGAMAASTIGTPCGVPSVPVVVEVEVIGVSFAADNGQLSRTPIYSIALGDPHPAEARAYVWSEQFGMYGLDATLWTRDRPQSQARWRRTELRRPRDRAEITAFADAPEAFKREVVIAAGLLPLALGQLHDAELAAIDHIVCFGAEGMRIALRVGVTAEEAATLLGRIRRAIHGDTERHPAR